MKYISLIKKIGFIRFINLACIELRKRIFVFFEKLREKTLHEKSYSQYAEDLFIDRVLCYKKKGTYVDVGANHPQELSNTKRFYDRGWRGINIEPNISNYKLFLNERVNDINLNIGVGSKKSILTYYNFEISTLSTFLKDVASSMIESGHKLVSLDNVNVFPLSEILDEYDVRDIDFLTIDTEGYDKEVLLGINWSKHRPKLICIEDSEANGFDDYFSKLKYKKIINNGLNSFFIDMSK